MFLLIASAFHASLAMAEIRPIDRLEAVVGPDLILLSDVSRFRRTAPLRSQLDPLFTGAKLASGAATAPDSEIIDFLINDHLILQQFPVEDGEVEQEVKSIQANNNISRNDLLGALKGEGYAFTDYFELIRTSVAKKKLIDRDIRTKVHVSEDDLKNYFYNQYPPESRSSFTYKIKMISVTVSNYKTPGLARETIDRAHQAVKAGEPFDEVAKRMSDAPTARAGGDLGSLSEDEMSAPIRQAVRGMKVGEVSDVLGAPSDSFFFLKLTDIRSGQEAKFEKMKEKIRSDLTTKDYLHQITLWLERARQSAFIRRAGDPPFKAADAK